MNGEKSASNQKNVKEFRFWGLDGSGQSEKSVLTLTYFRKQLNFVYQQLAI